MKKPKKFHLKFTDRNNFSGNRKQDSNYYRRLIASKKISYLHALMENIDQLAIVSSFVEPEIKPGLIDRFLVLAHHFNRHPFIVLTKKDLVAKEARDYYQNIYQQYYHIFLISNLRSKGFTEIKKLFQHHRTAIVGHSGVGKTSLLNHIDPSYHGMVKEISSFTRKGRHTTTRIKKHDFSFGGSVYDMPGLKEIDFIDIDEKSLKNYYPEFKKFDQGCNFKNCLHIHEPACAVRDAISESHIHPVRYQNYLNIFDSLTPS